MKKSFLESRWKTWRKIASTLCFLMMCSLVAVSQTRVSGTVIDAAGEPLIGVNIIEKGVPANGTITDVDGRFALTVKPGATLTASYIGYVAQNVAIGNRSVLQITLVEDTRALDEVVVVGFGTQKKAHLSGAVSTISSKQMENRPVTNTNMALQGLAPNVNIVSGNGGLMTAPSINVRGYTSINGGEALILVDEMPVSARTLSYMNPSDIESVSILKDAASAAIYGARAAYGVVLITTKTAKTGKLEINASINHSLHKALNTYKFDMDLVNFMNVVNLVSGDDEFNAAQIDYARQRMADPSLPEIRVPGDPNYPPLHWEEFDYYAQTDWWKVIALPNPTSTTTNFNIGQKSERLTYLLSGEYHRQDGLYIGEKPLQRYNLKGNASFKLTSWWSIGASMQYTHIDRDAPYMIGRLRDNGAAQNLADMYIKNPIKNPDGTYTESGSSVVGQLLDGGRYIDNISHTQLTFNTQIDAIKDVLSFKGNVNFRMENDGRKYHTLPVYHSRTPGNIERRNRPLAGNSVSYTDLVVMNFYGDFHKTFAEKHSVSALVGFNQEHTSNYDFWATREDLINEQFPQFALTTGNMTGGQGASALSLRGGFGRLNYTFDNRYIAEFNGRYDGTSRFGKGHRFGFFPSGTAAWILSQEKFFNPIKDALPISFLKLRASYGALGNQGNWNSNYYPYFSTMGNPSAIGVVLDGDRPLAMYRPGGEAAGNLTWEKVRTVNFGGNISLFNNRFSVEFDKYTRYTEGMLAPAKPVPAQFGAGVAATNAADLKTTGWELDVTWRDEALLNNSPLSYSVRFMLSDARAWIVKYDNPTRSLSSWREGQEVGEIWGYDIAGLFATDEEAKAWHDQKALRPNSSEPVSAGDMKFNDLDGNGIINSGDNTENNPGDRRVIGNGMARFPYSVDLNADWKGFDLRIFFQGLGKRDWMPNNGEFWSSYWSSWRTPSLYIRDRWTPENPNGYYPRLYPKSGNTSGEWKQTNSLYLQDASYLRLKNVTIGYTIPKSLTEKWKISNLRVYFSGENLWTLTHIKKVDALDPETVGTDNYSTYPMQSSFSAGINLSF